MTVWFLSMVLIFALKNHTHMKGNGQGVGTQTSSAALDYAMK